MLKQILRRFAARECHGRIETHYGLTSKCVFKSLSTPDPLFERRMKGFLGFGTEFADDFLGDSKYKGRVISDYSKMYFEEDKPYTDGSESTFNRPALLKSKRHSTDDALEADYLDVHIFGPDKELIGWIETSGTIMGKMPDITTIKTIEVIASMIGAAILRTKQ